MADKLQFRFNTRELDAGVRRALLENQRQAQIAMRDVKNELVKQTRFRVPLREGHLQLSITGDVVHLKKSWYATVYVPVNSPAAAYAVWLHEGQYNLGAESLAHQNKTGCVVGPKYITRAIQDSGNIILRMMQEALKK